MLRILAFASALLCAFTVNADARHRHRMVRAPACVETFDLMHPCSWGAPVAAPAGEHRARSVVRHTHGSITHHADSISGRPISCPARRWCGCWLANHLGLSDRSLWRAIEWRTWGTAAAGPQPGAIVVWRHHVGQIEAVDGDRIFVLSGNDGRAVRKRWRTTAGVIAYRILE